MTIPRTGLLIIRTWVEPGSSSPLRMQVRLTTDVSLGLERGETFTHMDAVIEAVREWLLEMTTDSAVGEAGQQPERSR